MQPFLPNLRDIHPVLTGQKGAGTHHLCILLQYLLGVPVGSLNGGDGHPGIPQARAEEPEARLVCTAPVTLIARFAHVMPQ